MRSEWGRLEEMRYSPANEDFTGCSCSLALRGDATLCAVFFPTILIVESVKSGSISCSYVCGGLNLVNLGSRTRVQLPFGNDSKKARYMQISRMLGMGNKDSKAI
jgi:hypothetical protein